MRMTSASQLLSFRGGIPFFRPAWRVGQAQTAPISRSKIPKTERVGVRKIPHLGGLLLWRFDELAVVGICGRVGCWLDEQAAQGGFDTIDIMLPRRGEGMQGGDIDALLC